MYKDLEYYINQRKNKCAFPSRKDQMLFVNKYLSEFGTKEEQQLARDNLGVTEQLELLKTLIDTKVIETTDAIVWDLEPTRGNHYHILSSDSLYKVFQKYYSKEEINSTISQFWEDLIDYVQQNTLIDSELSDSSEHPVQNKVIVQALSQLQSTLIPGVSIKNINEESLLGSGNIQLLVPSDLKTINGYSLIKTENDTNIVIQSEGNQGTPLTEESLRGLLKTINGRSLVGEGNIVIEGYGSGGSYATMEDLQNYVTKEEYQSENYLTYDDLYSYMNPLKVIASINPSLTEYIGSNISTTITFSAKKGNTVITPNSITLTYPDNHTETLNTNQITTQVNRKGSSKFTITCNYNGETASAQVTTNQVDATYIGFSSASEAQDVVLSNLNKKILSNISMTQNLQNQVEGNYLWIVSPYTLNMVATDPGFTFNVSMEFAVTLNGLKYYRSSSQLDISNITYYIK